MAVSETATPLAQVVGANVRRLRGHYTMEQLATEGRLFGANWSAGSVGAIEKGTFKPTVDTLVVLAFSLAALALRDDPEAREIAVSDLLQSDIAIEINPTIWASPTSLVHWLSGGTLDFWLSPPAFEDAQKRAGEEIDQIKTMTFPKGWIIDTGPYDAPTPGEKRLAKRAGIYPLELQVWSRHVWGTSIEEKRDEVAGPDSPPQKKGRVSRDLLGEIQAAMREKRGDD